MKQAYIVTGYRTAVGKAPRGLFRFKRPDELAAETIEHMMKDLPQLDKSRIDDVIVGNAMPEGAQGLNMARFISLIGLNTVDVPGVTVNRYCASGLETIGVATVVLVSGGLLFGIPSPEGGEDFSTCGSWPTLRCGRPA